MTKSNIVKKALAGGALAVGLAGALMAAHNEFSPNRMLQRADTAYNTLQADVKAGNINYGDFIIRSLHVSRMYDRVRVAGENHNDFGISNSEQISYSRAKQESLKTMYRK